MKFFIKLFLVFSFLLSLFTIQLHAQLQPVHTTEFKDACEQVYIHTGTGIPIFKTATGYVAIHPVNYKQMWEVKRQSGASISESTSSESFSDYYELPASNIVYVGNSLVDVLTGKVIVDGAKDEVRRIAAFHLFPAKNLLAVKMVAKGVYRLYGIDPVKNELRWKSDIDQTAALSLTGVMDNDPMSATMRGLKPYIAATGDIVYVHQKDMMLIDPDDGKVKWTQPLEPGAVLFSKNGKLIAIAERRTGLGSVMDMSGGSKYGKKLVVVDAATGENAWKKEIKLDGNIVFMQPYHDGFIVAHEEGFNIYDFNSPKGEPQWKKDFAAKEISDVVEDGSNIMVYYKDRRMLMNPVTGEDVWKKPEKLEEEIPVFTGGESNAVGKVNITQSGQLIRVTNSATKGYKLIAGEVYATNQDASALLATFDDRYNSNSPLIGQRSVKATLLDLNTMATTKVGFNFDKVVSGIHPVKDGWFIYTPNEFVLLRQQSGKLTVVKDKIYPIPGAFGRGLTNALVGTAVTASALTSVYGINRAYVVGSASDYQSYSKQLDATNIMADVYTQNRVRSTAPTIDKDYAFFFSKDKNDKLVLFQVKKENGEETATYEFDDKTPIYELDYVNGHIYYMNGKSMKVFQLKV